MNQLDRFLQRFPFAFHRRSTIARINEIFAVRLAARGEFVLIGKIHQRAKKAKETGCQAPLQRKERPLEERSTCSTARSSPGNGDRKKRTMKSITTTKAEEALQKSSARSLDHFCRPNSPSEKEQNRLDFADRLSFAASFVSMFSFARDFVWILIDLFSEC